MPPPTPMVARHGTAQNRAAREDSDPPPVSRIPTPPDPTRNGPLETTTMECQSSSTLAQSTSSLVLHLAYGRPLTSSLLLFALLARDHQFE